MHPVTLAKVFIGGTYVGTVHLDLYQFPLVDSSNLRLEISKEAM